MSKMDNNPQLDERIWQAWIQKNAAQDPDGSLYSGYIASGDELVELRRTNQLNIPGIKSLG